MPTLSAWDSPAHVAEYDYLASAPQWLRRRFYERYNEIKALPHAVTTIMEIGCATGELARYLLTKYPGAFYVGYDVSAAAIHRARAKQLRANFIYGHFQDYRRTAQLVICRDVVHHQDEPWQFLTDLYRATERTLIVRLRMGSATYNKTQTLYGQTIPYWILGQQDIKQWMDRMNPSGIDIHLYDKDEPPMSFWLRTAIWYSRTCM